MMKTTIFLMLVITVSSMPLAFADSDREAQLEFAGTLEETLGHFWALELNLDERNSKLAIVHATHPIAELYDTMAQHLENNPNFDEKLRTTLLDLQNKATIDVSRTQAQTAIDDAKTIIEEARILVVDLELSEDPSFKLQLANTLLETAKVEYREAVNDGVIEEVAEFQDGSAFVWRSQQILSTIDSIDPIDLDRIDSLYDDVWNQFDLRADSSNVEDRIDAVIYEYVELSGIDSVPSEHADEVLSGLPPLKQLAEGVEPNQISCKSNMGLVFKPSGDPACVKISNIQKLVSMGWSQ